LIYLPYNHRIEFETDFMKSKKRGRKKMKTAIAMLAALVATQASATSIKRYDTLKLYNSPFVKVNPGCDMFTSLTLDYVKMTALVENRLEGYCEIYVRPDSRVYKIEPTNGGISGMMARYVGEAISGDEKFNKIEITDTRYNVILHKLNPNGGVTIRETFQNGLSQMKYTLNRKVHAQSFDGQLFVMYVIGGETEGFGLRTANGQVVELSFPNAADRKLALDLISNDKTATVAVKGTFETRHGVERHEYQVLSVSTIAVLNP
jgi:hypothetical protein